MSARAAWRLEQLGFEEAYDYVGSKSDWFACGMPREGKAAEVPWAGDLARDDVLTISPADTIGELRDRVLASEYDFCVVLNEQRIVFGLLRGDALAKDPSSLAEEVMELGPKTILPSRPIEELLAARSSQGVKHWLVATSHGVLLGVLGRDVAERALEDSRAAGG
jgi:CBS-domain-containing membrane protein